ncbi:helix-turn-helix domain-containing protein [Ochrobactrum sp. C6C9]|uniref:helix-turn-helix domain-containing protein n=1 Tax=Ochrobactrum sp. C6C9 TaxID=2736662 RepID=UPI0035304DE0|nr:helix-turn-helix domain-containing protein [Ochrobactrum sp. C6C9]
MDKEHAFVAVRFQLLEQLSRDQELGDREVRIATFLLSARFNRASGLAWTSFADLAKAIGCSEKTVQRAIQTLEARNWFTVARGNGRGNGTRIEFCAQRISTAKSMREKGDNVVPFYPPKGGQPCPERRTELVEKGRQVCPTYQEKKYQNTQARARPLELSLRLPDIFIPADSDFQIEPWREWLHSHGLPTLDECGNRGKHQGRPGYFLPSRFPPASSDSDSLKSIIEHLLNRAEQPARERRRQG